MTLSFKKEILNKYLDVTIRLVDENDSTKEITNRYHKMVLASKCIFFDRMFDFEPTANEFELKVHNIEVTKAIIDSFYDIEIKIDLPKWESVLEILKSKNYLGFEIRPNSLYDLKIPSIGFELFVKVACLFDIEKDKQLSFAIKRNIPVNYDRTKFTTEMFDLLYQKEDRIVYIDNNKIKIIDCATNLELYVLQDCRMMNNLFILKRMQRDNIIFVSNHDQINIYDPVNRTILIRSHITNINHILEIQIDDQMVIIAASNNSFFAWEYESDRILFETTTSNKITKIAACYNTKTNKTYIFTVDLSESVRKYDSLGNYICKFKIKNSHYGKFLVTNDKIITAANHYSFSGKETPTVNIYELDTDLNISNHRVIKISIQTSRLKSMMLSNSGNFIVICTFYEIIVWNLNTNTCMRRFDVWSGPDSIFIYPDEKIIAYKYNEKIILLDVSMGTVIDLCQINDSVGNFALLYL